MVVSATKLEKQLLMTRRLRLRPLRPRDSEPLMAAIEESRARLQPWMPWVEATVSADDTLVFIQRMGRSPADLVWGIWSEQDGEQQLCGSVGLHRVSLTQGTGMLGYWVRRSCERRGYASEAATAVILWFFDGLGLERLEVSAAAGNAASLHVIEKLGFEREGILREAQRIPGRRRRLDWVVASLIRRDLRTRRARLRELCGAARPWES